MSEITNSTAVWAIGHSL